MLCLYLEDVPTLRDDMIYRFQWSEHEDNEVMKITSLSDLIHSQCLHYLNVNGRFIVHTLAQYFLAFVPPVVLQIVNAVLFVFLIHFITIYVRRPSDQLTVGVFSFFLLFIVFQGFRTAIFWSIGSFNYLWVLVGTLILLLWLRRRLHNSAISTIDWFLSPLAFFVGWSHEALSLPLSVAFLIYLWRSHRHFFHISIHPYIIFYLAGTLFCLLSPGIWHRTADPQTFTSRILAGAINGLFNVRILWLLLVFIIYQRFTDPHALKQFIRHHFYEFVALIVSFGIVLFCGSTLERVAFYTDFMAMLLLLPMLVDIMPRIWQHRLVLLCSLLLLFTFLPAFYVRHENKIIWQLAENQIRIPNRELIAVETVEPGKSVFLDYMRHHYVLPSFEFGFYCCYMAFDSNDVNIRCAARYFGKHRLYFLPSDVLSRIQADTTAYMNYELDMSQSIFIWQIKNNQKVNKIKFILNQEETSKLLPHQRLVAYNGNLYELDSFRYNTIEINHRKYLIFTKPTTNIYRRIHHVELD